MIESAGERDPRTLALLESADAAASEGHDDEAAEWLAFAGHAARALVEVAPGMARTFRVEQLRGEPRLRPLRQAIASGDAQRIDLAVQGAVRTLGPIRAAAVCTDLVHEHGGG